MSDYTLHHGDCLDILPTLEPQSVDAIICDPPYGNDRLHPDWWDEILPVIPMWKQCKRVIKPNGAILLFAVNPFSSLLVSSCLDMYRYNWVWQKEKGANFLLAKYQPIRVTEDILIFSFAGTSHNSQNRIPYFPQGLSPTKQKRKNAKNTGGRNMQTTRGSILRGEYVQTATGYPTNILYFARDRGLHPTQKPLALLEYLVKTYTNAGDVVLDFTMGSGTTGHACGNLDRRFIGIEMDKGYYDIASERIATAYAPLRHMQVAV